jgi:hypothetical protein
MKQMLSDLADIICKGGKVAILDCSIGLHVVKKRVPSCFLDLQVSKSGKQSFYSRKQPSWLLRG